ncbi:MAG: nucleotidyltransferase family protein [Verrucomicrobiota bacterium]|nr:nucleotidyltransferase family protein [Verrucomicrobiota bacterium]
MKLIVLAAGFATRLYPLTLKVPKALLPIGPVKDSTETLLIDHVLRAASGITGIDQIHIVVNALFFSQFDEWAKNRQTNQNSPAIDLVNDGATDENKRLGAVGDLQFVIKERNIDDDIAVIAGDNLFSQPLTGFGEYCRTKNAPVVGVYDVGDLRHVSKYSAVRSESDGLITFFEEKPPKPETTLVAIALYYYPRHVLPLIKEYLDARNNPDHSGRLIQWLYSRARCYAWPVPGTWLDVGSPETFEAARRMFGCENSLSSTNRNP